MAQDDWVYLQQRQFHVGSLGTDRVRRQQPCSRRALAEIPRRRLQTRPGQRYSLRLWELYETYSDAHARSVTKLDSFFSTHTSAGKSVRELTVRAFRTLAGIADFAGTTDDSVPVATEEAKTAIPIRAQQRSGGVTININVQLVLPDTTDEALYDRFFGAMKKHLLASDGE